MTRFDRRVYGWLLRAYPREFRERYRPDLEAFFESDRHHPRYGTGPLRLYRFWSATLGDLLRGAVRQRVAQARREPSAPRTWHAPAFGGLAVDVRQAWRRLSHAPASTAVATLTLALGIGVTTAIYALAYGVWLKPLPYRDPGRLATVVAQEALSRRTADLSAPQFDALGDGGGAFDGVAGYFNGAIIARINGERVRVVAYHSSPNLFDVLGVSPGLGPGFSRAGAPREILLSDHLWSEQFGRDPSVIGRAYDVDGIPHTVVGVMPRDFHFPQTLEADAWVRSASWQLKPDLKIIGVVARLRTGVTLADAQARLDGIARAIGSADHAPDRRWTLHAGLLADEPRTTYARPFGTLVGITLVLLALACTNAAAILLTRASARRSEIAMRMALGATRARLARELLAESTLLTFTATLMGVVIAMETVPFIRSWLPPAIPRLGDVRLDGRVLAVTACVSAATAIVCGFVPLFAHRALSASAIGVGGPRLAGDPSRRPLRVLAVAEVALTVLLMVSAGLMVRAFSSLVDRDHGFDPDHLLTLDVSLPFDDARFENAAVRASAFESILERVRAVPGVVRAGATTGFPGSALGILGVVTVQVPGSPPVAAALHACSDDYFAAMDAPLDSGRAFDRRDAGERTIIVSRTLAARLWPDAPAAAHTLVLPPQELLGSRSESYQVVGIAADMRLSSDPTPRIYVPLRRTPTYWVDLVVRTSTDPRAVAPRVRAALREVNPDLLLEYVRGMDQIVAQSIALQRAQTLLAALVAGLASLLSAAGLYGLLSYGTLRRMRELGVRMALGATPRGVFRAVLRDALGVTGTGAAIGVIGAALAVRLLGHQVFGLGAPHWSAFVLAPALMLAVAVAAVWAPARRAATVDPLMVIRES